MNLVDNLNIALPFQSLKCFKGMCFTQIQPIKDYTTISLLKISISTTWFTCIFQIKRTYSRVVMRLTEKIKGYEGLEKLIEQLKHGQIMNKFILVQQPKIEIQILNNFFLPSFFFDFFFFSLVFLNHCNSEIDYTYTPTLCQKPIL